MNDVSRKINDFIETEGKGDIRDALNVALARIERLQGEIHDLRVRNAELEMWAAELEEAE